MNRGPDDASRPEVILEFPLPPVDAKTGDLLPAKKILQRIHTAAIQLGFGEASSQYYWSEDEHHLRVRATWKGDGTSSALKDSTACLKQLVSTIVGARAQKE